MGICLEPDTEGEAVVKVSKEAARKIPAALGLFLILELSFGSAAEVIEEFFNNTSKPNSEQLEANDGR